MNLQKHNMSRALQHKHFDHKSGVWFWHMTDQQTLKMILDDRIAEARDGELSDFIPQYVIVFGLCTYDDRGRIF